MQTNHFAALCCVGILFVSVSAQGQVLKKLGDKAKSKVEQRANNKVDQAMDKGLDGVEDGAKAKKEEETIATTKNTQGTISSRRPVCKACSAEYFFQF